MANAVTALDTEHFPCPCLATFTLAGVLPYCVVIFFVQLAELIVYKALATATSVKPSYLLPRQIEHWVSRMIDLCSSLTTIDLLWVCIASVWAKNIAYRLSTATTDGPKCTSHFRVSATIVCWIRHKYLLLSFNCLCLFFIHLQTWQCVKTGTNPWGFVQRVLCWFIYFLLLLFFF